MKALKCVILHSFLPVPCLYTLSDSGPLSVRTAACTYLRNCLLWGQPLPIEQKSALFAIKLRAWSPFIVKLDLRASAEFVSWFTEHQLEQSK